MRLSCKWRPQSHQNDVDIRFAGNASALHHSNHFWHGPCFARLSACEPITRHRGNSASKVLEGAFMSEHDGTLESSSCGSSSRIADA